MSSIFEALADPTRQRILALLRDGERPVGELVDTLGVAQPSVSKHLARLKAAGLVDQRAEAQRRVYRLTPGPLRELESWLGPYLERPTVAGAVVETEREEGPLGWVLRFETMLQVPAATVWNALTNPDRLQDWLGKAHVDPGAGGKFRIQVLESDMIMGGRSVTWNAPRQLECRWRINPKEEGPSTRVAFDLADELGGVRLAVTQRGLPAELVDKMATLWSRGLERLPAACA